MINITWCWECKIGVKIVLIKKKLKISQTNREMAEQVITSEAIVKAVVETTRIAIQTMAEMQAQRSENQ